LILADNIEHRPLIKQNLQIATKIVANATKKKAIIFEYVVNTIV